MTEIHYRVCAWCGATGIEKMGCEAWCSRFPMAVHVHWYCSNCGRDFIRSKEDIPGHEVLK